MLVMPGLGRLHVCFRLRGGDGRQRPSNRRATIDGTAPAAAPILVECAAGTDPDI
jgi:hypothetical protein